MTFSPQENGNIILFLTKEEAIDALYGLSDVCIRKAVINRDTSYNKKSSEAIELARIIRSDGPYISEERMKEIIDKVVKEMICEKTLSNF